MALIILAGMVAVISWQRSAITEFYYFLRRSEWKPQTTSHETRPTQPKFSGRVPQEKAADKRPGPQRRASLRMEDDLMTGARIFGMDRWATTRPDAFASLGATYSTSTADRACMPLNDEPLAP